MSCALVMELVVLKQLGCSLTGRGIFIVITFHSYAVTRLPRLNKNFIPSTPVFRAISFDCRDGAIQKRIHFHRCNNFTAALK